MKVLYVIDSMAIGGAEAVVRNLVSELISSNQISDAEVAVLYEIGKFGQDLEMSGIKVHNLGFRHKYDPLGIPRLVHLIRSKRFDIVHVHLFPASYFGAIASLTSKSSSFIFTEHNAYNRRRNGPLYRFLDRHVYHRYEEIISVSQAVAAQLASWLPEVMHKNCVIPNGVLVPDVAGQQARFDLRRIPRILFAGTLKPAKGVDILLYALGGMKDVAYELVVAGDGPDRKKLQALSEFLGLDSNIRFIGKREDLNDWILWADCMVVPSRWEGLPMVVLESMSFGTPVVASMVGGIPEVIEDGKNGWLIEPENIDSLSMTLKRLLGNPAEFVRCGNNARETISEKYSITNVARKHSELYRSVLKNR